MVSKTVRQPGGPFDFAGQVFSVWVVSMSGAHATSGREKKVTRQGERCPALPKDVSLCDLSRIQVECGSDGVCECARVPKVIGLCVLQRLGLIAIQWRSERRLRWELKIAAARYCVRSASEAGLGPSCNRSVLRAHGASRFGGHCRRQPETITRITETMQNNDRRFIDRHGTLTLGPMQIDPGR